MVTLPNNLGPEFTPQPVGLTTDASGMHLYVTANFLGYIAGYSIDPSTGVLTPLPASSVDANYCVNLRLDASGTYLYCPTDGPAVGIYSIDASTGGLTTVMSPTTALIPVSLNPNIGNSTDIGFTSDDRYAYITDSDSERMWLFAGNPSTGVPTLLTPSSSFYAGPEEPYAIAIDPGDQLAYVVDQTQDCNSEADAGVQVMTINADGTLSNYNNLVRVAAHCPVSIAIYP